MSKARAIFEAASTGVIALAAVVMASIFVYERGLSPAPVESAQGLPEPRIVEDWELENTHGVRIGPADARVTITEFMDFECPFCARLVSRMDTILSEFPNEITVVVQHFPLSMHRFAVPAAIAAECSDRQGRFEQMYRLLFAKQDSLGLKPWRSYAAEAQVLDIRAFEDCQQLSVDSFPRIGAGLALGSRTGVHGTPTVWINGRAIGRSDLPALREWVERTLNEPEPR